MNKRFFLLTILSLSICLSILNFPIYIVFAQAEPIYYRISPDTLLYRSAQLNENDAYFILPSTYFVKLNYEVDENTLAVSYLDIDGFVKKSDVTRVYSTPTQPYLNDIYFSVNQVANLVLRTEPSTTADYVGTIPFSATQITYLGSISGEQVYENFSNTWYYCRYTSFEQGIITGYVYAPLTVELSPIQPNTEIVALEPITPTSGELSLSPELQSSSSLLLIILLTIPALFILYLALKSNKNKQTKALRREFKKAHHLTLRAPPHDDLDF